MKETPPDSAVVRIVDELLDYAVRNRASDVHFEPAEDGMAVRMRVDGDLTYVRTLSGPLGERAVSRLKVISGMDLTQHRRAQDGRASLSENVDIRVATLPTLLGEKATVRILDKLYRPHGPEPLGIEGENRIRYDALLSSGDGLTLIVGPTGSGKSTTLYEILCALRSERLNIVTLEDPVEYRVGGINQIAVDPGAGMGFSFGMQSVLRQDPDLIAVGEIRDPESAEATCRAAITGHPVFSTVHSRNAAALPDRMAKLGIPRNLLEETLRGVICQRLVRRLCPECGGAGCDACRQRGYAGRIGVFGILIFPDGGPVTPEAFGAADEALAGNCRRLISRGITSREEVQRVLGGG